MTIEELNKIPGVDVNPITDKYEFHGREVGMPELFIIAPDKETFLRKLQEESIL